MEGKRYRCLRRSVIRAGFDMDSDKAGTLEKGTIVVALDQRANAQGTMRVRFAEGWTSLATGAGIVVLEEVAPLPQIAAEEGVPPPPQPALQEDEEDEEPQACQSYALDMSAATFGQCKCGFPKLAHTQAAPARPRGRESRGSGRGLPRPEPEPELERAATGGKRYRCQRRAVIRAGFDTDSDKASTLEKNALITVLEERDDAHGVVRVRFADGWISKMTAAGLVVLADIEPGAVATEPKAAQVPAAAPPPVPLVAPPVAASVPDVQVSAAAPPPPPQPAAPGPVDTSLSIRVGAIVVEKKDVFIVEICVGDTAVRVLKGRYSELKKAHEGLPAAMGSYCKVCFHSAQTPKMSRKRVVLGLC